MKDRVTGLPLDVSRQSLIREQWDSNWGYCGETSLIAAGMSFGQYASQFTVRELASPGIPQEKEASQLLLGVNDQLAAQAMRLSSSAYENAGATLGMAEKHRLASWIRDQINAGARVILGVYSKALRNSEYDHIVPLVQVSPRDVGTNSPSDLLKSRLFFSDNYGHLLRGSFRNLFRNRRSANISSALPYSIPNDANNFALAISGVVDHDQVTIPVMLQASRNDEPLFREAAQRPPVPEPLGIRATVLIADQSQSYNVYRYDSFDKVPEGFFNASSAAAVQSWVIPAYSGDSVVFDINVLTSDTVVFRAVPVNAS